MTGTHPNRERLADFLGGRLNGRDFVEIERHVAACDSCVRLLEAIPEDAFVANVRAAESASKLLDPAPIAAAPPDTDSEPQTISDSVAMARSAAFDLPAALLDHPRYEVIERLGGGGMGSVYKAKHRLMQRLVALKLLNPNLLDKPAAVERFRREVQAAAQLSHPNIVTAHDADEAEGQHFLVMEFVAGRTLDRVVRDTPLAIDQAVEFVRAAALGLEHAFEHNLVHRDIKPQNLMITPTGQVKILDFGLARFASESSGLHELTEFGTVMGTADYIAPEQARDARSADIRADIYSLGCTLYFALSGKPPFPGGGIAQKLVCHLERQPQPITERRADVPAWLARVLDRMLAKDPTERFQTPGELAEALARADSTAPLHVAADGAPSTASPATRNPFGVSDVAEPDAEDVLAFAAESELHGGHDDENAAIWSDSMPTGHSDSLDGQWASRWRGGTAQSEWVSGIATVKCVGARVFVLYADSTGQYLIDARRDGEHRLLGRYAHLSDPANSTPWVGLVVDSCRIDGRWGKDRWDLRRRPPSDTARHTLRGHSSRVIALAFSPDGHMLASVARDDSLRLWSIAEPSPQELRMTTDHVSALAFSPDGRWLATASAEGVLSLRVVETLHIERESHAVATPIHAIAFSPNGRRCVTAGNDGTVTAWDIESAEIAWTARQSAAPVLSVAFHPSGEHIASSNEEGSISIWAAHSGALERSYRAHTARAASIAFVPDGSSLVSVGYDQTIRVWDWDRGVEQRRIAAHGIAFSVAASPDGRAIAVGTHTLTLYDLATGEPLGTRRGHQGTVLVVTFSPDGRTLASGCTDYNIRLWDVPFCGA